MADIRTNPARRCNGAAAIMSTADSQILVLSSAAIEDLFHAPAPMVVLTRQDLVRRGYTSLQDVFADLPGYGYARASKEKIGTWTALIHAYLLGRPNLRRLSPAHRWMAKRR